MCHICEAATFPQQRAITRILLTLEGSPPKPSDSYASVKAAIPTELLNEVRVVRTKYGPRVFCDLLAYHLPCGLTWERAFEAAFADPENPPPHYFACVDEVTMRRFWRDLHASACRMLGRTFDHNWP